MRAWCFILCIWVPSVVLADAQSCEGKEVSGESVYEQHCIACHEDGVAGAPKIQNDRDWQARLAKKNIDDLVKSALNGLNAMPAKGTCVECCEQDIKAAIEYMVPHHE